jgi:hypothetical protein
VIGVKDTFMHIPLIIKIIYIIICRWRLAREHGYGADEIAKMLDKKDLINALSYEEHRLWQKEEERKKRVAFRRSIIVSLICVIFVIFKPLFSHAWEVLVVNFEVYSGKMSYLIQLYPSYLASDNITISFLKYTDKKKYEFSKIRELRSLKAAFGLFLTFILNLLQLWLSVSVLLSWVMKSEYFFPVPYVPIRPAELLATAAGGSGNAGALGNYGINIGPMIVSWLFRYMNEKLENFMGLALQQRMNEINKEKRKATKAAQKEAKRQQEEMLRQERKEARRARRAEREMKKQQAASGAEIVDSNESSLDKDSPSIVAKTQNSEQGPTSDKVYSAMDELD